MCCDWDNLTNRMCIGPGCVVGLCYWNTAIGWGTKVFFATKNSQFCDGTNSQFCDRTLDSKCWVIEAIWTTGCAVHWVCLCVVIATKRWRWVSPDILGVNAPPAVSPLPLYGGRDFVQQEMLGFVPLSFVLMQHWAALFSAFSFCHRSPDQDKVLQRWEPSKGVVSKSGERESQRESLWLSLWLS